MTMTSTTSPLCSSTYCSVLGGSIRSPFALRILISLLLTWFPAAGGGNTQHQTKKPHNLHRNHKLVLQSYLRVHICTTSGCVLITITCFNSPFLGHLTAVPFLHRSALKQLASIDIHSSFQVTERLQTNLTVHTSTIHTQIHTTSA